MECYILNTHRLSPSPSHFSVNTHPMSDPSVFSVNEQVIVEDGGLFYMAKIIEMKDRKYKIHYNGWSSRFDKWVKKEELNKDNEMNRALMKYSNNHGKKEDRMKGSLQIDLITEMSTYSDSLGKYQFPIQLREQLIEEWFMVTNENLFLPLPRKTTIREILHTFLEEAKAESKTTFENASELVQGIVYYMSTDAKQAIFYSSETDIVNEITKKSVPLIDIFGVEHLLRLLFIVPMLYGVSDMSESETQYVHEVILLLLDFILRHSQFFCSFDEYVSAEQVIQSLQWTVCATNNRAACS